jgi:L-histidine Nalpha-methyltransferase
MAKGPNVLPAKAPADELTSGVLAGLKKTPKELSPMWFYDEIGSSLFDSICDLPEYYITRTELGIMHDHAAEMAERIGPRAALIELGSGTSVKTRLLLDHLESLAAYVPIDISREHLLDSAGELARDYPELSIVPVCTNFTQSLRLPIQVVRARRRIVYFPGSTLGNFEEHEAQRLLRMMRAMVGSSGAVLIGIDLKKNPQTLERAYDDSSGLTAAFNLNALRHLNHELGANFDLHAFEHCALWVEDKSRIEMHLVSKRDQVVMIGDETIEIARGEHLRTEYCHKYTLESFDHLATSADLAATRVWLDPEKKFSVQFLEPRSLQ